MRHTPIPPGLRDHRPTLALVLGSGAARGWAHIGVIRQLADFGIRPDLVAGSSVGSIVAGAYAANQLDAFEAWITGLGRVDIIRLLDAQMTGGGFLQGKRLMAAISRRVGNPEIADLELPFACVATELGTGREVWLRSGSLLDACRASIALPGLFAPARREDGSLLVDGGLVNPVPVSLARAMGAEIVIAVNLNGDLIGYRARAAPSHPREGTGEPAAEIRTAGAPAAPKAGERDSAFTTWMARLKSGFGLRVESYIASLRKDEYPDPGLFDVIVGAIDVMQDRITRSRMAGEPPDIQIAPRLNHIGLMDFDRAEECIAEGREATLRQGDELKLLAESLRQSGAAGADPVQ